MSRGPVWGTASEDLNATILEWPAGEGPEEHVNGERDVLVAVLVGALTVTVDGTEAVLQAGEASIVPKGSRRRLVAGLEGVRYLSAHVRRGGLQIALPDRSRTR